MHLRYADAYKHCVEKEKEAIAKRAVFWRSKRDVGIELFSVIFGLAGVGTALYGAPKSFLRAYRAKKAAIPYRERANAIRSARDAWRAAQGSASQESAQAQNRAFVFKSAQGTETPRQVPKYSDWPGVALEDPRGPVQVCGIPPTPRR